MTGKIKIKKSKLSGVYEIKLAPFKDFRGKYIETFNSKYMKRFDLNFVQDDISVSKYRVLRGIHGDFKTWKLVTCLYGSFYLVVVNNIKQSKHFRKWISFTLTEDSNKQVLIPPGFGNAHLVLSKKAIFHYKQTTFYNRNSQFTINYRDPLFNFKWPLKNPILSKRDD